MSAHLSQVLAAHASSRPDHPAIICLDRRVSYRRLHEASRHTAQALVASGCGPGSRVAYLGKESEHYYDLVFGCAAAGTVLVPVNWRLTSSEVAHILADSGTCVLFVERDQTQVAAGALTGIAEPPQVVVLDDPERGFEAWKAMVVPAPAAGPELPSTSRETPLAQLYTSGTTGLPKGVVLAQRSFFAVREALAGAGLTWIDPGPDDVLLIGIPGFHVGGLWWSLQGFVAGATNVALRGFVSSDAVRAVRDLRITAACVVPAMLQIMLDEPEVAEGALSSLRKVVYGGAPISEALLARCIETIGCEFAQIYGLTETGNTAVCLPPDAHRLGSPRLLAAGLPYPGFGVKILGEDGELLPPGEIGEICLRTPARMVGYWQLPEATASTLVDDWIHTGDAGRVDEDGYVYVCDRLKDTIIVAGENVYPAEIENALSHHPGVREVAVVGIPDERWGEAVHAVVVIEPGAGVTPRALMLSAREHLADFKVPASYEFIEQLPRNPSGKILRRSLREKFWMDRVRQVN